MRDPSLPHQIVIQSWGWQIAVSCNCMRTTGKTRRAGQDMWHCKPIECRSVWEPGEAFAVWEKHMAEQK